jgi:hypothetical protein
MPFWAIGVADVIPQGDCPTGVPVVGQAVWLGPRALCYYKYRQSSLKPDEHCLQPGWIWFPHWPTGFDPLKHGVILTP